MSQPIQEIDSLNSAEESEPEKSIIEVQNLWKIFGQNPKQILNSEFRSMSKDEILKKTSCIVGIRNANLNIRKGEFYIIMGLSGSGKSTLIRNLIRLIDPTVGSIYINNNDVTKMAKSELLEFRRSTIGMVFQHYALMPHITVLDNVAYGLKVRGLSAEEKHEKAMASLELVGLKGWENYYPESLSGGMQQRVGLARALANDPQILLMDEPFSGLDPLIRRQMQDELVELQDRMKKTIVFVTHDLHEALKLGDRIHIMRDGQTVQIGTPEEIVTEPANDYVRDFVQDASPAKVITAGSIMTDPKLLLYAWAGPKTALTILQKEKRNGAFVVDKEHKLLGVSNKEMLQKYLERSQVSNTERIHPSLIKRVPTVNESTILEDIFSIVNANPYPVPVVNEQEKLLGVVQTDDIFETISPNNSADSPTNNSAESNAENSSENSNKSTSEHITVGAGSEVYQHV